MLGSLNSKQGLNHLGNNRRLRKEAAGSEYSPLDPDAVISRLRKWALQSAARDIIQSKSLNSCCRTAIKRGHISIVKSNVDTFSFNGLMTCGSVWSCPICAIKVSELRRLDLQQGIENWIAAGHGVFLLTLTVPHYRQDKCQDVLVGLSKALRRLFNRDKWKTVAERIGYVGRVRALEVMHGHKDWLRPGDNTPTGGFNGFHPHFHLLIFTKTDLFKNLECDDPGEQTMRREQQRQFLEAEILSQWQSCCVAVGLGMPNKKGCELKDGAHAARYVTKWGIDCDMTKSHLKKSSSDGHVSPFGLLGLYLDGEKKAGKYFKEYAETFFGKKQLHWSSGLRKLCGLDVELTDEELAKRKDRESTLFAVIPPSTWRIVLAKEQRGYLLEVCHAGEKALEEFLISLLGKDEEAIVQHLMYMAEYSVRQDCIDNTLKGMPESKDPVTEIVFPMRKTQDQNLPVFLIVSTLILNLEKEQQYSEYFDDHDGNIVLRKYRKGASRKARGKGS